MPKFVQSRPNNSWSQVLVGHSTTPGAYDRHLCTLRQTLREQRERMAESIAGCFPAGTRLSMPSGGLVMWVELPANMSSMELFDAALAQSIRTAPGTMFSDLSRLDHFFRICFGLELSVNLEAALTTFGQLTQQLAER